MADGIAQIADRAAEAYAEGRMDEAYLSVLGLSEACHKVDKSKLARKMLIKALWRDIHRRIGANEAEQLRRLLEVLCCNTQSRRAHYLIARSIAVKIVGCYRSGRHEEGDRLEELAQGLLDPDAVSEAFRFQNVAFTKQIWAKGSVRLSEFAPALRYS